MHYGVKDYSRDRYKGNSEEYKKFQCKYLKVFTSGNNKQEAFLTNDEGLTFGKVLDEKYNGEFYDFID